MDNVLPCFHDCSCWTETEKSLTITNWRAKKNVLWILSLELALKTVLVCFSFFIKANIYEVSVIAVLGKVD